MANVAEIVRDRLDEIEDELDRLNARIASLRAEAAELEVAQRVLARLHVDDEADDADLSRAVVPRPEAFLPTGGTRRKPTSLPAVTDMILKVLENAEKAGIDGLEPRIILAEIQRVWWPDASSESVGPIAWRMSQQGRLRKDGPVYSLPKKESARSHSNLADLLGSEPEGGEAT
ncbi:hypothetical protein [Brevundimonas fontaquae]|uniref:HTH HARE-type domain-containing protein n=1 Tax=Brevundimonas fontaquae TaxID=2813778 RepID=A0ABX7LSD3_9CAUL|nr:hypothetical protein [Brevundimonas fontaquae]QSF54654.1 hypothetical protein JX001_02155 [Brevundimonas fontaquae]